MEKRYIEFIGSKIQCILKKVYVKFAGRKVLLKVLCDYYYEISIDLKHKGDDESSNG